MVKVTIYTPVYNASKYIQHTIQSILNQTFTDWEYLIFDDGSTDNTKNIVQNFASEDKRIIYKCYDHTGNPAYLRNQAITVGTGEWFASCDHDDIWHPLKLELQFNLINKLKLSSIVFTSYAFFKDPSSSLTIQELYDYLSITTIKDKKNVGYRKIKNNSLLNGNYIMNSSALVHKTVYENIGVLDENIKLRGIEDFEFWLRASCNNIDIYQVNEILSFWREHPGNLSNIQPKEKLEEVLRLIKNARKCKGMKVENKFSFYYMINYTKLLINQKRFHNEKSIFNGIRLFYSRIVFQCFVVIKKLTLIRKH